jgi:O-antigen ligase
VSYLILGLVAIALVVMQVLRGGWLFASSLPAYGIVAVAAVISCVPFSRILVPQKSRLPLLGSALFFGYIIIRTLISPVDHIARPDLFIVLGSGILYLLTAFYATSPRLRTWLVAALLLLGCANGLIGAVQYFKGENFMVFSELPRADYGKRASGFFGNPNQLAGFLEIALLLGLSLTWWGRWKLWGRIVAGYGTLMCIAALLISGSRGGYASALTGVFAFVVLSFLVKERKSHGKTWVIGLVTVLLAAALAFTAYTMVKRSDVLRSRVEGATGELPLRVELWKAALQQFTLSPVVGTGSATYLYYGRMFRGPIVHSDPIYAHSDYLQLLAEYGLLGFGGFLLFLGTHLRAGWRSIGELARSLRGSRLASGSNSIALTIGAMSAVAAYMVHSFVDFNLHIPANALLMGFVFGLLANPGSIPQSARTGEHEPTCALPYAVRLLPPALGVWLLFAGLQVGYGAYYAHRAERILADWKFMDKIEIAREAEKFARLGLERDPKNLDLYRALGDALFALASLSSHLPEVRERYLADSVETYQRALALAPMDRNLILGLCWTYDEMKRFPDSIPLFQRALEIDPNSMQVRAAYAAHLEAQGRIDDAVREYQKAADAGAPAAILALRRITAERHLQRTGAENDAPRIGR